MGEEVVMLEILRFVFQDFAHWIGTVFLILAISLGIAEIFRRN